MNIILSNGLINDRAKGEIKDCRGGNDSRGNDNVIGDEFGAVAIISVTHGDTVDKDAVGNIGHIGGNGVGNDESLHIVGDKHLDLVGQDRARDEFAAVVITMTTMMVIITIIIIIMMTIIITVNFAATGWVLNVDNCFG